MTDEKTQNVEQAPQQDEATVRKVTEVRKLPKVSTGIKAGPNRRKLTAL